MAQDMTQDTERFVRKEAPPDASELAAFLGAKAHGFWQFLIARIAEAYPGIFAPDWTNGDQKHGWGLRYKKSKSFCTLIPERGAMSVMIVFGGAEREKMATILPGLNAAFRTAYDEARTYHDGKWVRHAIRRPRDIDDVMLALKAKRRPKPKAG